MDWEYNYLEGKGCVVVVSFLIESKRCRDLLEEVCKQHSYWRHSKHSYSAMEMLIISINFFSCCIRNFWKKRKNVFILILLTMFTCFFCSLKTIRKRKKNIPEKIFEILKESEKYPAVGRRYSSKMRMWQFSKTAHSVEWQAAIQPCPSSSLPDSRNSLKCRIWSECFFSISNYLIQ